MKVKKATWLCGITTTLAVGLMFMGATRGTRAARDQENAAKGVEIKIDNFSFGSMTLKVAAGTTVTWTNNDDVPHTVVSEDKTTFKSRALDMGEKFSYTFAKPGKYPYFCSIHPKMTAEIVVQ